MPPIDHDTFSVDDDTKLLELIKKHPFLFDPRHDFSKNQGARDYIWKDISNELNRSTEVCKKRWKNIKDTYNKLRRTRMKQSRTGQSTNNKRSKWVLAEFLTFLDDIPVGLESSPEVDTNKCGNSGEDKNDDNDCTKVAEDKRQKHVNLLQSTSLSKNQAGKINQREVLNKQLIKNKSGFLQSFQKICDQRRQLYDSGEALESFFKSITLTVRGFPPRFRIIAKAEIFKLVTNLEIENSKTANLMFL